jgi:hypothetical protein
LKADHHLPKSLITIAAAAKVVRTKVHMTAVNDTSFEDEFERRASGRIKHNRGALLRIAGLSNLFELTVRDVSDRGIGIRLQIDLPLLPVDFEVSDNGFRTAQNCRLIWRQSNFLGAEFIDQPQS